MVLLLFILLPVALCFSSEQHQFLCEVINVTEIGIRCPTDAAEICSLTDTKEKLMLICDVTFTEIQRMQFVVSSQNYIIPTSLGLFPSLLSLKVGMSHENPYLQIPTQIGDLVNLQRLDLSSTGLRSLPPIPSLTALTIMDLSFNHLETLPDLDTLGKIERIQLQHNDLISLPKNFAVSIANLDLSYNNFSEFPESILALTNLLALYLSNNNIKSVPPELFLLPLETVSLSHNQITDFSATNKLSNHVVNLDLSSNRLTNFTQDILLFQSLTTLNLGNNSLSDLPSEIEELSDTLTKLYINGNKFKELPLQISALTLLETLSFANNQIKELPFKFLFPSTLQFLDARFNKFQKFLPQFEPSQLSALTRLFLGQNNMTGSIPTILGGLVELDLSDNAFTGEAYLFPLGGNLSYFNLRGNKLTNPYGNDVLYSIESINLVDLSENLFTGVMRFNRHGDRTLLIALQPYGTLLLQGNRFQAYPFTEDVYAISIPQDRDDCEDTDPPVCGKNSECVNGWFYSFLSSFNNIRYPALSYTCACQSGYKFDVSQPLPDADCIDINECENENSCPSGSICRNTVPLYECDRDLTPLWIVLGVFFGLLLLILCCIFGTRLALRKHREHLLDSLPDEVSWTFKDAILKPERWETRDGYKIFEPKDGSTAWRRAQVLYDSMFPEGIQVCSVHLIYNESLVSNFVSQFKIQTERFTHDRRTFFLSKWKTDNGDQRDNVYNTYRQLTDRYYFNQGSEVTIVPSAHGTDYVYAEKIAATGFAALSSLDAGWFGKGIYFTSQIIYTIPYIMSRRNPAIIISWVLPGNCYPVIEDHRGPQSLMGKAMITGYQSHFIRTDRKGECAPDGDYDEFVISQEAQIVPAYIFKVKASNLTHLGLKWNRVLPSQLPLLETQKVICIEEDS